MELGPPDVMERKGALTLRSNLAYYGRPTLVSGWSQNREAEPKDYDINQVRLGSKNLCQSTYWRFGNMDQKWITTYQDYLSSPCSKKEYKDLEILKPLLDEDGFHTIVVDRETGLPETGFGAVLPRHPPEKFKIEFVDSIRLLGITGKHPWSDSEEIQLNSVEFCKLLSMISEAMVGCWSTECIPTMINVNDIILCRKFMDTSYRLDYVPPYDYIPYVTPDMGGYSVVHRKCHSQFTDTANYKRHGINTWQDESGVYATTDLKQKVFPVTNPIPINVDKANS